MKKTAVLLFGVVVLFGCAKTERIKECYGEIVSARQLETSFNERIKCEYTTNTGVYTLKGNCRAEFGKELCSKIRR